MSNSNIIFFSKTKKYWKRLSILSFKRKLIKNSIIWANMNFHERNTNLEIVGLYDVIAWVTTIALVSFKWGTIISLFHSSLWSD